MTDLVWPERPTCHDEDYQAARFGPSTYRDLRKPDAEGKYGYWTTRTCSHCGSMAPEDLYRLLTADGPKPRLGGSDWKYGWPHKFYIDEIPLPADWAGLERVVSSRFVDGEQVDIQRAPLTDDHGKFYSQHLNELGDDAFAALAPLIETHTGIRFSRDELGRLKYAAPHRGYQR